MTFSLDEAAETLAAQPFSTLVGARLTAFADGTATLEIAIRPDLLQQHGFVHGGVLSYAADNALTFAAGTVLGPSIVTAGFSISYLRPAVGTALRAVATAVSSGRRQALCRCEIYVDTESGPVLCAAAQGTATVIDLGRVTTSA
ncbi:PaaI family thioesterase [Rhodococcus sp. NPDC058514]|uniref:PaaI family thioesterase n=1 Tax=unclassified Rhodococcus (in: high G+C Gram-positive bacteria) TaxID=192944 RepID=UPI0036552C54